MIKIDFDKIYLKGLYLYLLQIEMSIDRALHSKWKYLVVFFSDKIRTKDVIQSLNSGESIGKVPLNFEPGFSKFVIKKRMALVPSLLSKCDHLYEDELIYICGLLQTFNDYLCSDTAPDSDALIALRMGIYNMRECLSMRLDNKFIKSSKSVEHFNHNVNIKVQEIEAILGNSWPKS